MNLYKVPIRMVRAVDGEAYVWARDEKQAVERVERDLHKHPDDQWISEKFPPEKDWDRVGEYDLETGVWAEENTEEIDPKSICYSLVPDCEDDDEEEPAR